MTDQSASIPLATMHSIDDMQVGYRRASAYFHDKANKIQYFYPESNPEHSVFLYQAQHFKDTSFSKYEREKLLKKVAEQIKTEGYTSSFQVKWDSIAAQFRNRSAMELYMQYHNVCGPDINQSSWTTEEEKKLLELAQKYEEHNWIAISNELGTHRTPYDCLSHYQQTMNHRLIQTSEWSVEEDKLLKRAVETYGLGQWQHVASTIPNRTASQCINRWRVSLQCQDIVDGTWKAEEERRLILSAMVFNIPALKSTSHGHQTGRDQPTMTLGESFLTNGKTSI